MKLILTAEVDHLGIAGDTVEVKDGYGRNYPAAPRPGHRRQSRGAERQAEEIRRAREVKTVRGIEHANELKTAIEGLGTVELPAKDGLRHRQAVRFGHGRRRRRRDQEGRRTESRQADGATAQGAHQDPGTHPVAVRLHPDVDAAVR